MAAVKSYAQILSDIASGAAPSAPASVSTETLQDLAASTHPGGPAQFGKAGTQNPVPGAQRLIGLPALSQSDQANNRVLGQASCATGTTTSKVKTTNQVDFMVNGSVFRKAATDDFWTLSGTTVAVSKFQKYLLLVDNAGAASIQEGTQAATAAAVVLPTPPPNKSVFGTLTIATDASHTFIPGTTLLGAAGITATFVDGLDPLYAPTIVSTPIVSNGGSGSVDTITSSVLTAATVKPGATWIVNTAVPWRYLGGQMVVVGQGVPDQNHVASANSNAVLYSGAYFVEFEMDGSQVEFWSYAQTGSTFRIMVDGQYESVTPRSEGTAGSRYLTRIDFNGIRQPRRIKLEFSPQFRFGGLRVGPNDTIWTPSSPVGPRVVVMGDSFTNTGSTSAQSSFIDTMSKLLGWKDVYWSGIGGTGYLNPGAFVTYRTRVQADLIALSPDICLIAGGYNDSPTYSPAQIGAEAGLLFAQIRAALPNCKIMVVEQWSANGSPTQTQLDVRASIQAALAAISGSTLFIDTMVTTVPGANSLGWITGTGHVGATTGTGNADLYVGSDGIHPTQAGHDYYGRRFAAAIAAAMPF